MKIIYLTACAIVILAMQAISQNLTQTDSLSVKNIPQISAPGINSLDNRSESLVNLIKTGTQETEPYMAPDESYLIFTSKNRPGGYGGWDLWICFHQPDSSWTEPTNMGPKINTAEDEYGPRVSPYGNFLLFNRENRGKTIDIYWVSIRFIDTYLKTEILA